MLVLPIIFFLKILVLNCLTYSKKKKTLSRTHTRLSRAGGRNHHPSVRSVRRSKFQIFRASKYQSPERWVGRPARAAAWPVVRPRSQSLHELGLRGFFRPPGGGDKGLIGSLVLGRPGSWDATCWSSRCKMAVRAWLHGCSENGRFPWARLQGCKECAQHEKKIQVHAWNRQPISILHQVSLR